MFNIVINKFKFLYSQFNTPDYLQVFFRFFLMLIYFIIVNIFVILDNLLFQKILLLVIIYSFFIFLNLFFIYFSDSFIKFRRLFFILIDLLFLSFIILFLETVGMVVLPIFFLITVVSAIRFGYDYLLPINLMSIICFSFILFNSSLWQDHLYLIIGIYLGIILFPFVIYNLLKDNYLLNLDLRKQIQNSKYFATHDFLTKVANRFFFSTQLDLIYENAKRNNSKFALFFIDLNKFKNINDNYGHDIGDKVLIEVADRLKMIFRKSDLVSRFGGDEFVVLIKNFKTREDLEVIAKKVVEEFSKEMIFNDFKINFSASIGIACYPKCADNVVSIMKIADEMMYKVKNTDKSDYFFCQS